MELNSIFIFDKERSCFEDWFIPLNSKSQNHDACLEIRCTFRTQYCLERNFLFVTMSCEVRLIYYFEDIRSGQFSACVAVENQ